MRGTFPGEADTTSESGRLRDYRALGKTEKLLSKYTGEMRKPRDRGDNRNCLSKYTGETRWYQETRRTTKHRNKRYNRSVNTLGNPRSVMSVKCGKICTLVRRITTIYSFIYSFILDISVAHL